MLDLLRYFIEKPSLLVSSRFCPVLCLASSAPVVQGLPVANAGWTALALLGSSLLLAYRAIKGLPHEMRLLTHARVLRDKREYAKALSMVTPGRWFASPAYQVARDIFLAGLAQDKNDLVDSWQCLQRVAQAPLLPQEEERYVQLLGQLYFFSDNYRDLLALADSNAGIKSDAQGVKKDALLQSYFHEVKGQLAQAKAQLEQALIMATTAPQRIMLYNNLARLEGLSSNKQEQLGHLLCAATELCKTPLPVYYETVYHNLLITLARMGRREESLKWLKEYARGIDSQNLAQVLGYANDSLHVARELNDTARIQAAYKYMRAIPTSALTAEQHLAFRVSELRMTRNDGQSLHDYIQTVERLGQDIQILGKVSQAQALLAIIADVKLEMRSAGPGGFDPQQAVMLSQLFQTLAKKLLDQEQVIDVELQRIPPSLLNVRVVWLKHRHALITTKILLRSLEAPLSYSDVSRQLGQLFDNLEERIRLAMDKANQIIELDACLTVVDEFISYRDSLGQPLHDEHHARVLVAYDRAAAILSPRISDLRFHAELIGMAWYSWKLGKELLQVKYWFDAAERIGQSQGHYALWLRAQYQQVKQWLEIPTLDKLKLGLGIAPVNTGQQLVSWRGIVMDDMEHLHAVRNEHNEVVLHSGVEIPPYLYRGQTQAYFPCVPSLGRLKTPGDLLMALCRNAAFESALRNHPYVSFCSRQRLLEQSFHINTQGLAQHYGLHTNMLDVTSNFDVASFFATCYWDSQSNSYQPIEDENRIGVIYRIQPPLVTMTDISRLTFVGWQPLRRPEQQRACALILKNGEDFTQFPHVESVFFRQSAEVSRKIWRQFEQGKSLFPDDEASTLADRAMLLFDFTETEINVAWQRLEAWQGIAYTPEQRQSIECAAKIKRVETCALDWHGLKIETDTNRLEQRFAEEMQRVRWRWVSNHVTT